MCRAEINKYIYLFISQAENSFKLIINFVSRDAQRERELIYE